ncbi:trypsin-like serine peptidase [Streptomyces sp. NPDC059863]|uniref:trypsin-like serine peptidase n=1 Tax=unclassified Streptomyces TaxID=2593676 RepID=UPI00364CA723
MCAHHDHPTPPLTLDDVARLDDIPAEEKTPDEVRAGLSTARATVTVPPGEKLRQAGDGTLILPEGSFYGRPMAETTLHKRGSLRNPDTPPPPYRPPWQPLLHYPRTTRSQPRTLRRINGRTVVPLEGGHVYGEYPPRQTYFPSGYPWTCIGRVLVWQDAGSAGFDWSGTAALVGKRAVLTASHMVPWGAPNGAMQFVAGYFDGSSSVGQGGQSWATTAHGYAGQEVTAHDMAVVRLADPLGDWLGFMGTKPFDSSWQGGAYWTSVGYPGAVSDQRPSFQSGIHVIDDDEDGDGQELEHHADETPGDSGGPFFAGWSDGPYAVGTVAGYEVVSGPLGIGSEDNNISAGGPALGGLVGFARANWT